MDQNPTQQGYKDCYSPYKIDICAWARVEGGLQQSQHV